MRRLLALLLALLVGAQALAAPARDWRAVVRATPAGSYVIGNPAAKVKLVEYVSYTCPHCRHFTEASRAVLVDTMVKGGSTSLEVRNQIHDKVDLVAAALARCVGPAGFLRYHEAVYAAQDEWFRRAVDYDATGEPATLPTGPALAKAFAEHTGLAGIALRAGMTQARLARCFADARVVDAVFKASEALRPEVTGTPAFEINGRFIARGTWADIEPQLRAAGAK